MKYLFVFLVFVYFPSLGQNPSSFKICLRYNAQNPTTRISLILDKKYWKDIPAIDTCLQISNANLIEIKSSAYEHQSIKLDSRMLNKEIAIEMVEKSTLLDEVKVEGSAFVQNGDTLTFFTNHIKTAPHSNASSILENLPGGFKSGDGSTYLLGRRVKSVLVDGMSIFGGNTAMVLALIKAEMVSAVEITNLTSGNAIEVNLVLKEDKKKGVYGELTYLKGTFAREAYQVKINRIAPKLFMNFNLDLQNTNQRNQQLSNLNTQASNFFKSKDKGASYLELLDDLNANARLNENASNTPTDGGINAAKVMAFNYTKKLEKGNLTAFSLFESNNQVLTLRDSLTTKGLSTTLYQNSNSLKNINYYQWWNTLGWEYQVSKNVKVKLFQYLRWLKDEQTSSVFSESFAQAKNTREYEQHIQANTNSYQFTQQFMLAWKHKNPVNTTTLTGDWTLADVKDTKDYKNTFKLYDYTAYQTHQRRILPDSMFKLNIQVQQNLVLNRKWLSSVQLGVRSEKHQFQQSIFEITKPDAPTLISNTFIPRFEALSNEVYFRQKLIFQKDKWLLGFGLTENLLTYHNSYTKDTVSTRLQFFPQFYLETSKADVNIKLKYIKSIVYPEFTQISPIIDSTYYLTIRNNNPLLLYMPKHTLRLSLNAKTTQKRILMLTTDIEKVENNILNSQAFNELITVNNYTQRQKSSLWLNSMLIYYAQINNKLNISTFTSIGMSNDWLVLENQLLKTQLQYIAPTFRINYRSAPNLNHRLELKSLISKSGVENKPAVNGIKTEFNIHTEYNWKSKIYSDIDFTFKHNKIGEVNQSFVLTSLNLSGYVWNNRIKLQGRFHNIFNQNPNVVFTNDANQVRIQDANYMPRYLSLSASFFISRWDANKK